MFMVACAGGAAFANVITGPWNRLRIPRIGRAAPEVWSRTSLGGVLEVISGELLVHDLVTRPVAFILAGEVAIAYWWSHAPRALLPIINGGNAAILYCVID